MQIDPAKPHNLLPLLPPDFDFRNQDVLIATFAATEAIARLDTLLTMSDRSITNSLDLLSPLFVPEAVSSSGVENIVTTNIRVYEAKMLEERELTPAEKEALNYTAALTDGALKILSQGFLATNDYIALQKIIEPANAGLRSLPGTQLSNPITKEVYYTPPEGEALIRKLLANYEAYFNEEVPSLELYTRMAILHYQFEAIHPFADGNGRTGRMLMPLYLMKQKRLRVPVLFISRYILEHRDEYYEKLRNVTYKGEWKEWILYITQATAEQANYTWDILIKIQRTTNTVRTKIKDKFPAIYRSGAVDFLFSHVYFTQKDFEAELKISPMTARKYLLQLETDKIVIKRKQTGRNRYIYITPSYIRILTSV